VADDGCGMDQEVLSRACEPFFTTKPAGEGTGLGMWVSTLLVEELGGRLEIESRKGQGTRVAVVLPAGGPLGRRGAVHEEEDA